MNIRVDGQADGREPQLVGFDFEIDALGQQGRSGGVLEIVNAECLAAVPQILELASTYHSRFQIAKSDRQRELLEFMLSNSSWVDGKLEVEMFEAFGLMLKLTEPTIKNENETLESGLVSVKSVELVEVRGLPVSRGSAG